MIGLAPCRIQVCCLDINSGNASTLVLLPVTLWSSQRNFFDQGRNLHRKHLLGRVVRTVRVKVALKQRHQRHDALTLYRLGPLEAGLLRGCPLDSTPGRALPRAEPYCSLGEHRWPTYPAAEHDRRSFSACSQCSFNLLSLNSDDAIHVILW